MKYNVFTKKLDYTGGPSSGGSVEYIRDGWSTRFSEDVNVLTVEEALDQIFDFGSLPPSLTIAGSPAFGLREYGNDIVNPTISSTPQLGQNPDGVLTLLQFYRGGTGGTNFANQATPTPGVNYAEVDTITISDDQTYTVRINDDQGRSNTRSGIYNFVHPFYWGVVDEDTDIFDGITRAQILALAGMSVQITLAGTKAVTSSPSNERYCFMYPAEYGALTSIIDNNGFETIGAYNTHTYNVQGLDGLNHSYRVYILNADTTAVGFTNTYHF